MAKREIWATKYKSLYHGHPRRLIYQKKNTSYSRNLAQSVTQEEKWQFKLELEDFFKSKNGNTWLRYKKTFRFLGSVGAIFSPERTVPLLDLK